MEHAFTFSIKRIGFDEHYHPADSTRLTTNFANLARGAERQQNLRNTLAMINQRFNSLAHWDNPAADRYTVELEIISVDINIAGAASTFPSIEVLKTSIVDHQSGERIDGLVGNNFSSYLRDYDFSVLLPAHNKNQPQFSIPADFGDLHGHLFKHFVSSPAYQQHFHKLPVICLSVSDNKIYQRSANQHPVLGVEYLPNESSLTEQYFKKMGLNVRYFMPHNSVAPLAFYFFGDLLNDYSNLELIATISTMETFQKIYRPEIYNAHAVAGLRYQPNLTSQAHSLTRIVYDREERSRLAVQQGQFAEEHFIKPYQQVLAQWSASFSQ
ncbi:DUF1852 domain-containing protein [Rheinheimera sp. F8]|uniref:DUF1852 domain-containing protein n=1 Tax=Rheinheimera sp. F8 TaxID=1763998 RepID=UPI000744A706|nr:DUF1852 domain-containing protein [Rheinheimera sp. F8]ALZ74900.1 hypothetical protein ATY27_03420 [Rheinheimera sp. F8]